MFVSPEAFARQMDHLARRRSVVPLGDALREPDTDRPPVAVTFDDAYRSFAEAALPVLRERGFPVTLFAPSGKLGGTNTWDEGSSCDRALMTADEIATAAAEGVEIASHGHMHVDLVAAGPEAARADLAASVEALTAFTGGRPRFLAYPWGRHDESVRSAAAEAGFDAAFAVNAPSGDSFGIERVQVEGGDAPWLFALKTAGLYSRLRRLRR